MVGGACGDSSDCTNMNCDSATATCLGLGEGASCNVNADCDTSLYFCLQPFNNVGMQSGQKVCAVSLCVTNNGGCDPNGKCTPTQAGDRVCSCPPNWYGSGYYFLPPVGNSGCWNPCEMGNNGGCYVSDADPSVRAQCIFLNIDRTSVQCLCPFIDGKQLIGNGVGPDGCSTDMCNSVSVPYTQPANGHVFYGCPSGSSCQTIYNAQAPNGYLTCVCDTPGQIYVEPDAGGIVGFCFADPCTATPNGNCPANSVCFNDVINNKPLCQCQSGFAPHTPFPLPATPGAGPTCTPSPCTTFDANGTPTNGGCSTQAVCVAQPITQTNSATGITTTVQTASCTCITGYLGDGVSCVVDPCFPFGPDEPETSLCATTYANTGCLAVILPPQPPVGLSPGFGGGVEVTCPCLTGFDPADPTMPGFTDCV